MKIKVSVPATSANVGSGFDALGLAVTLYNTVTFEDSEVLEISASDGTRIPRGESNLVYRSAKGLFEKVGKQIPPLKITQTNPIPMARGLGSSSACIIAGLLGANRMLGDVLNTQELLTLATAIEGHPDNVAPALLGGLTSSVFEDGKVYSVKRNVDETLCFAAIVPDYKLLTEAARAALPKEVSHKDAVYNLSRAALVPAAFCEGRHDLLAIATEDKLHQPYRMPLMPGSKEVFDMARLCGAKAVYVSGAGSTVMAVAEKADAEKIYADFEPALMAVLDRHCDLIPGILETMEYLRQNEIRVGSTTGFTREMMAVVTEGARRGGYAPEMVQTADSNNGFGRPWPYMIFSNMRGLGLSNVRQVVKVGDTTSDMAEAKNAGVIAVGVCVGSSMIGLDAQSWAALPEAKRAEQIKSARQRFYAAGADYVIESIGDLPALIEDLNARSAA